MHCHECTGRQVTTAMTTVRIIEALDGIKIGVGEIHRRERQKTVRQKGGKQRTRRKEEKDRKK